MTAHNLESGYLYLVTSRFYKETKMRDWDLSSAQDWTGAMFFRAATEYSRLTSRRPWTESEIQANPPRAIRLRRLNALSGAFDVRPKYGALFTGEFLEHRPIERLAPVREAIAQDLKELWPSWNREINFFPLDSKKSLENSREFNPYQRVARYLREAYNLVEFNSGVSMASGMFLYSVEKTNRANRILSAAIEPIEQIVGIFIDPENRSRSLDELKPFGWPEEDLREIDINWQ